MVGGEWSSGLIISGQSGEGGGGRGEGGGGGVFFFFKQKTAYEITR